MKQRGYRQVYFDGLNDFYLERGFATPDGLTLSPNVFDRFVPREIADLRIQLESLQFNSKAAEECARVLRLQAANLTSENRRLRRAGEQMRAELLALDQLLEPLHAMTEQREMLADCQAELASVYSSLSWRLTAVLRWCDGIQRRIAAQRKRLGAMAKATQFVL
jgi:chromosome segregation ATPase